MVRLFLFLLIYSNLHGQNSEPLLYSNEDHSELLFLQYPDSIDSLTKLIYFYEDQWIYTEGNLVSVGNHFSKFINFYDLKSVNVLIDSVFDTNELLYFYFPPVNYNDLFMKYSVTFKDSSGKSLEREGPIIKIKKKLIENWGILNIDLDYIDVNNLAVKVPKSRFFSYYYRLYLPVDMDHYFVPYNLALRIQEKKIMLSDVIVEGGSIYFKRVKKISNKELGLILKAL